MSAPDLDMGEKLSPRENSPRSIPMTDAPSPSAKAVDRAVELLTWISQWLKENPNRVRPDELRRIDFETLILLAPALTAERERVKALEAAIRGLVNGWNAKVAEINRAKQP